MNTRYTNMPKMIVFGSTSRLSYFFHQYFGQFYHILFLGRRAPFFAKPFSYHSINIYESICNSDCYLATKSIIDEFKPSVVINSIALTNIEACEGDKDLAYQINTNFPYILSLVCKDLCIKFVHISTDHLYSDSEQFYSEQAVENPVNCYALTKLAGDKLITLCYPEALICRLNFFGKGHEVLPTYSDWVIRTINSREKLFVSKEILFNPLPAPVICNLLHQLIDLGAEGIFNLASDSKISKYDFVSTICKVLALDQKLICDANDLPLCDSRSILRPNHMTLSNLKLVAAIGSFIGDVETFISPEFLM